MSVGEPPNLCPEGSSETADMALWSQTVDNRSVVHVVAAWTDFRGLC